MLPQLYHAHHNRYLEDLPFWLGLAAQTGEPILELGCGTGRVLIRLAQAGYRSIGIDHSLSMLKFLQLNIGQIRPAPWLIAADIRGFNLAARFPLIILPCNTFSTLQGIQRLACLRCIGKHLQPGGIFAVSMPNPEYLMNLPARSEAEVEDEFSHPETGNPVQISSSWWRTKHIFTVTWIYDHLYPDGRVERSTVENTQEIVPVDMYTDEIRSAGMKVTGVYGDFDRSIYGMDSLHLICVATN